MKKQPVTNQLIITLEVFLAIFLRVREKELQVEAKTSCEVARKRKTSGTRVNVANQRPQNGLRFLRKTFWTENSCTLVCDMYSWLLVMGLL